MPAHGRKSGAKKHLKAKLKRAAVKRAAVGAGASAWKYESAVVAARKAPKGYPSDSSRLDLRQLRQEMNVRQDTLARMMGYSPRAVAAVEGGGDLSLQMQRAATEVQTLSSRLKEIIPAEDFDRWLKSPNAAFDGASPLHLMESGKVGELWRMVYEIGTGQLA
jgi:DNA-binding XRE family transcriptional regulator